MGAQSERESAFASTQNSEACSQRSCAQDYDALGILRDMHCVYGQERTKQTQDRTNQRMYEYYSTGTPEEVTSMLLEHFCVVRNISVHCSALDHQGQTDKAKQTESGDDFDWTHGE